MKTYLKRAVVTVFTCLLAIILAQAARQEAERKADFVFAYNNKILAEVDPKDAIAAMKIYVEELATQAGYHGESQLYDTLEEVVRKVQENTIDLVALSSMDYLRIKNRVDIELSIGQVTGGKGSVKYLLLTNVNRGYTKLGDLKNKKLLIPKGDDIAALYLNTVLLKNRLGEVNDFFSSVEEKTKPSQVVLAVFFGQADACVTTDTALQTMMELNPQIGRSLNIMTSSPELVTSVSAFRRSVNADLKKKTIDVALNLKDNPRGRQILLLFKIDSLTSLKESDLAGIRELVSEYDRLRTGKR
jgi:ABC-type phosphate/phosphonate transport system substrate-binding protein